MCRMVSILGQTRLKILTLGIFIRMNVMNGQLREWKSRKLREKFMYWKSQFCSFHVCLKVVQCIMNTMILYYVSLLQWTKKYLHSIQQPLRHLVWRKRDKWINTQVAYNHLATPKRLGRVAILELYMYAYNGMQVFINARLVFILTTIDMCCPTFH